MTTCVSNFAFLVFTFIFASANVAWSSTAPFKFSFGDCEGEMNGSRAYSASTTYDTKDYGTIVVKRSLSSNGGRSHDSQFTMTEIVESHLLRVIDPNSLKSIVRQIRSDAPDRQAFQAFILSGMFSQGHPENFEYNLTENGDSLSLRFRQNKEGSPAPFLGLQIIVQFNVNSGEPKLSHVTVDYRSATEYRIMTMTLVLPRTADEIVAAASAGG